jgi:microcystin-dependent protein
MFVCPEVERVGYTARELVSMYVNEKRIATNAATIQGSTADGNNGVWQGFKRGYVREDDLDFKWFAKSAAYPFFGRFPELNGELTVANAATRMNIAIENQTGLEGVYWRVKNIFDIDSPFWFTAFTPDGLSFMLPAATGTDRGTVFKSDCIARQDFDRGIGYYGSGEDIEVYPNGNVLLPSVSAAIAAMVVNKAIAAANYIVFAAAKVYAAGDYVRSWDGRKYVVLSGRKIDSTPTYAYTAVLESTATVTAPTALFGTGGDLPVGTIEAYVGAGAPLGYLLCDGSSVLRARYPDLFAVIGTSHGTADGTHFNVPDLRGKFLRFKDGGAGYDPNRATRTALKTGGATGDNVGSYQADEFYSHHHNGRGGGVGSGGVLGAVFSTAISNSNQAVQSVQSNGGNETRPKNVNENGIIKY